MKKQLQRTYSGLTALLGVFVLTFLGLGSCMNPLQAPAPAERSSDGSTGVRISIVTGEERTLLPSTTFSKYVLSFSNSDGVASPSDMTLTANTEIVSLEPANWTITVTAFVEVESVDVPSAEGSAEVTLGSGELKGVSIRVSSKIGGGDGYFSYDVQYPADVQYGWLNVYDIGTSVIEKYLTSEPSGNKLPLPAGYYGLQVRLNTNYGVAVRTEIVHIYPGMETRGDYVFSEADFGIPITISGTVDLSGLESVNMAEIILHRNSDFTYSEASFYEYGLSGNWSWAVKTLPFNQPTDLYVELRLQLSGGGTLTKRLPAPISVYNQDAAVPALGPFTVNQFNLSGVVDFSDLTSLGITVNYAYVEVYQDGSSPGSLGNIYVNPESGPWSFGILTEETSLPVRIVLQVRPDNGPSIYDEIQTTLTASRSDLDFTPGPISAGTTINGAVTNNVYYGYLFVPDTTGDYAFTLNAAGSEYISLSLYDAAGGQLGYASGWYSDLVLSSSSSLSAGAVYYIELYLNSPYRAFHFRVDPVSQASLGGTVNFSGLLSPFSGGVTVSSADITVYAGNSAHTMLGTGTINTGDGSWSATVDLAGQSIPAIFVITANLSNGQTVYHQEYLSINGSDSGLNFNPGVVIGGSTVTRTIINQYDYLLYIPETTGDYSLTVSAEAGWHTELNLYDAQTGNFLTSSYGYGKIELVQELNVGNPYLIRVYSWSGQFSSYQFQAETLQPVTLSGTVNLNGLAPLTSGDINYVEIQIYNGASNPVPLGPPVTAESNGTWSATISASGTQAVRIAAHTYLNNGRILTAHRQATVSGNTAGLDLAPAAVSPASGQPVSRVSSYHEDLFLLVPSTGGFFNLTAISGMSSNMDLYLYNAATGAELAQGVNSLYTSLTAGTPYIVQVYNTGIFAEYQFQMSAITSTISIGGTVSYSGLPSSISSAINSVTISGYLEPSHTQIVGAPAPAAGGAWSALVPSNAAGETATLVLTLNLNNGLAINSHIQTVLSASGLDFAPAPITDGTAVNGKTGANGDDWLLFVPSTSGDFLLQAESDTYTGISVHDVLTGSWIGGSSSYLSAAISLSLDEGKPYIIQISCGGNSSHDYQFKAEEVTQ
jgi:hypothetical protein